MYIHVNERCRRKEERSKQGQINNKAKQHSTPKAVTFPKKNELPRVGLEPKTLYTLDRALLPAELPRQLYCVCIRTVSEHWEELACTAGSGSGVIVTSVGSSDVVKVGGASTVTMTTL